MSYPNIGAGLYAKLIATSTVTTLVSTRIYHQQAPQGTLYPYLVFNSASGLLDNTSPHQDVNTVWRVKVVAKRMATLSGTVGAWNVLDAVHGALHRGTISVSGWSVMKLEEINRVELPVELLVGEQIFSAVSDYRIRLSLS